MIVKIAIIAITGAFLTAQLKNLKPEYGQVLLIGMGVFLFFFALSYLDAIKQMIEKITSMITIPKTYLAILMKMVGIAYVCEFASNLCKDAGCQTIGSQVEMIGKLSMLLIGIPVITSLTDTISSLF
ncbi:MAG: stage III sporulation protein AD [Lachnospiraceae bacterium]|nr:stage III sporulation protein AD [Lachnospiraceae bacterium]